MNKTPTRLKLREKILEVILTAEYYAGLNKRKAILDTVDGIVILIQNNYRCRKQ